MQEKSDIHSFWYWWFWGSLATQQFRSWYGNCNSISITSNCMDAAYYV